jgi:hypothetical protein
MRRRLPSQTLEEHFLSPATRQGPLSETIRLGAQLVLQKAVELDVIRTESKSSPTARLAA